MRESWEEKDLDKWNVNDFLNYVRDKHKKLFGIDYAPMGGRYAMEQGVIGTLIGTQSRANPKPRTASNEDVKEFIDITFATYTPTAQYPGTSFGFMWTYRKTDWQRIQYASATKSRRAEAVEASDIDDVADWFAK